MGGVGGRQRCARTRRGFRRLLSTSLVLAVVGLSPGWWPMLESSRASAVVPSSCTAYTSPSTGSHQVCGAILAKYVALGGPGGFMGYPTTDETGTPDGVGRFNHFSSTDRFGASIYWTPRTGAWSIRGLIRDKWASLGWERSPEGYPVSDEFAIPNGRQSNFQNGRI